MVYPPKMIANIPPDINSVNKGRMEGQREGLAKDNCHVVRPSDRFRRLITDAARDKGEQISVGHVSFWAGISSKFSLKVP